MARIQFAIVVNNRADVLPRVVILFHRLNVEIATPHLVRRPGSVDQAVDLLEAEISGQRQWIASQRGPTRNSVS
jgi:hypothetical protein